MYCSEGGKLPDLEALKEMQKTLLGETLTLKGVERQIKLAVILCWMMQADEGRTPENVAAQVRQAVEHVLADLKAAPKAFGVETIPSRSSLAEALASFQDSKLDQELQ